MQRAWSAFRRRPRRSFLIAGGVLLVLLGLGFLRFAIELGELRARRAVGPAWSFPSRVYGAGVPLIAGRPLPERYLRAHLAVRGYVERRAPLAEPGTWARAPGGVEIYLRGFEEARDPAGSGGPERVRLDLAGGQLRAIQRVSGQRGRTPPDLSHPPRLEPVLVATISDSLRVRRTWVPLARVPQVVRDAVVAAEDRRFYGHFGLDLRSNLRALVTNVRRGGLHQGGSTITQQLARGLFLGTQRTWARKIREMFLAIGLELLLSKDQILEMYLNSAYWGQGDGGGIAGVAEASRWYFGAPVEALDLGQAALLAGLIPAPNAYSPFHHHRLARARRDAVLADLIATGKLGARAAARERRRPIEARRGEPPIEAFPSYVGYVRADLDARLPAGAAEHWGLAILTPLDVVWQLEAESALAEGVAALEHWRGRLAQPLEGAFIAIEPSTGYVRAAVGGRDPGPGQFNRAIQARRQPGSAMKPIAYAAALDRAGAGPRLTPASTVPDLRRSFSTPQGAWTPQNDEGDYHESVTIAKALAKSLNIATTNLVEAIGPDAVVRYAERFGLGKLRPVASVGLGVNEVTLADLVSAYAAFPNGGVRRPPTPVRAVIDARGHVLLGPPGPATRAVSAETAALMTGLLEDVVIFGVSYPLRARHGFTRPVAGKTGTTNDYNDAWFVGFTPDVSAGVWVGYDTPQSLARPAAETALPVWATIMNRLLEGFPATAFPSDERLVLAWIDPWSGGLARSDCPRPMRVPFLPGTEPRQYCSRDHTADWEAIFAARLADSLRALGDSLGEPDTLGVIEP